MVRKLKYMGIAIVLSCMALLPFAKIKADQWNQETEITINEPLAIPGHVLPPGNYVFQLAGNHANRNIVQIFNQDHNHLITTVLGIPAYRPEARPSSRIVLREEAAGSPDAISRWFFAGQKRGVGFVYPNQG